ncbi:MAG: ABC transporter ATP-binding protein [Clostridia bacterium]|nr:ABC transporter ATP-binding protein [Clostridia bacterium]
MESAVVAERLTKRYGQFEAVRGIDFEVRRGECFGFLGPNGAGKSSTMRMIYGRTGVSSGTLRVLGLDVAREVRRVKRMVGVVPQESNLDSGLTTFENLALFARYYGIGRQDAARRARRWLEFVGLADVARVRGDELSGGMQRRAVIARALLHDPGLVVLDEPTTGLDPAARHAIWQKLAELKAQGVTLVLTTHYMDEAQRLCDRLVVMDYGRILAEGRPDELRAQLVGDLAVEVPSAWFEAHLGAGDGRVTPLLRRRLRLGATLFLYPQEGLASRLVEVLNGLPAAPRFLARPTNLEDVFLVLTGRELAAEGPAEGLRTARSSDGG